MNTKALGHKQKQIIKVLLEGGCITSFTQLSPYEHQGSVWQDSDKNDWYGSISEAEISSLRKRGIIDGKLVRTTVQPDTDSWEFLLTEEAIKYFKP